MSEQEKKLKRVPQPENEEDEIQYYSVKVPLTEAQLRMFLNMLGYRDVCEVAGDDGELVFSKIVRRPRRKNMTKSQKGDSWHGK